MVDVAIYCRFASQFTLQQTGDFTKRRKPPTPFCGRCNILAHSDTETTAKFLTRCAKWFEKTLDLEELTDVIDVNRGPGALAVPRMNWVSVCAVF